MIARTYTKYLTDSQLLKFWPIVQLRNYILALDFGLKRIHNLPMSLRLIKEFHKQLMQGVRGVNATPGEFRKNQNWIGTPGCTLNTAKFIRFCMIGNCPF